MKVALNSREWSSAIVKNNYHMSNMEHLMDLVAEQLDKPESEAWFTSLDMLYAYGQPRLDRNAAAQCICQFIGGKATGMYRFITGLYGLTIMRTDFQKIIDRFFYWLPNTYTFTDNNLIVTKGTKVEHWLMVKNVSERLDKSNIRLKLGKCKCAEKNTEWLGFYLLKTGIKPISSEVQGSRDHWMPKI